MVEVYYLKLNKLIERHLYYKLLKFVSDNRKKRVKRFLKYEDAILSLMSELLIRYLIISKIKVSNDEIKFYLGEHGKPFIKLIPDFYYNITNTSGLIVCGIDKNPIGVDAEIIRPIDLNVAKIFFSKEEFKVLENANEKQREECFYELWTYKESYLKQIGTGLSKPLNSFSICYDKDEVYLKDKNEFVKGRYFKQINLNESYKIAVCFEENEFNNVLKEVYLKEVYLKDIEKLFLEN